LGRGWLISDNRLFEIWLGYLYLSGGIRGAATLSISPVSGIAVFM
jgi:hypothetical protein